MGFESLDKGCRRRSGLVLWNDACRSSYICPATLHALDTIYYLAHDPLDTVSESECKLYILKSSIYS